MDMKNKNDSTIITTIGLPMFNSFYNSHIANPVEPNNKQVMIIITIITKTTDTKIIRNNNNNDNINNIKL